jgi:hypothetical protein
MSRQEKKQKDEDLRLSFRGIYIDEALIGAISPLWHPVELR